MYNKTPFNNKYTFREVSQKTDGDFVSIFTVENEYYTAKIFYMGNYDKDRKNNIVDLNNISIKIKPKNSNLTLSANKLDIYICDEELKQIEPKFVKNLSERLLIAAESANYLKDFIKTYFK